MTEPTELFAALEQGDLPQLRRLLEANPALASARNQAGVSALLLARYQSRQDMVDLLLAANPALDIFEAAALGQVARARELLERQPELASAWSADGFNPLHLAAFFGQPQVAELLLERGAQVSAPAKNPMKVTPLHSALATQQRAVVRLLLEHGAAVNAKQEGGWTPLHTAADRGDTEMIKALLAKGADRKLASENGKTPLDMALAKKHEEAARLLEDT